MAADSPSISRDVELVCAGGRVVRWNSVALCLWSNVMRQFVTDRGGVGDAIVVLLPEISADVVVRALAWSVDGKVNLGRDEMREVTSLLFSMGVNVAIRQDYADNVYDDDDESILDKGDYGKVFMDSEATKLAAKINPKMEEKKINLRDKVSKPSKESTTISVKASTVKDKKERKSKPVKLPDGVTKCPLCQYWGKKVYNVKEHLATTHYKTGMKELWMERGASAVCFVCAKEFDKATVANSSSILRHLGAVHDLVLNVMPEKVIAELIGGEQVNSDNNNNNRLLKKSGGKGERTVVAKPSKRKIFEEEFYQGSSPKKPKIEDKMGDEKKNIFSELKLALKSAFPSCATCQLGDSFKRPGYVKDHLALVHYEEELVSAFGESDLSKCDVCKEDMYDSGRGDGERRRKAARHMCNHHQGLKELVPENIFDLMVKLSRQRKEEEDKFSEDDVKEAMKSVLAAMWGQK